MNIPLNLRPILNSLQGRFIIASLLCLPLFIGGTGLLLERAFKISLQTTEQEQLQSQLYILLGAAELQNGNIWLPEQLPEPRYTLLDSGLYARISSPLPEHTPPEHSSEPRPLSSTKLQSSWLSTSASLLKTALPDNPRDFKVDQRLIDELPNFFRLTFDSLWLDNRGTEQPLRFQIFHHRSAYLEHVQSYRQQLWYGLSLLSMGMLIIQIFIMRWGLRPLQRLGRDLKQLPASQERQLQGQYPAEITAVTDNLNLVLKNEQQQRERYRNTLNDLAHSLKTPLAILQGEILHKREEPNDQTKNAIANEQLERMDNIICHQLQRAVLQTNRQIHSPEPILPIVERLCGAIQKVYREKSIQFNIVISTTLNFAIESQDLFELLGNLIENACKYGHRTVDITASIHNNELSFPELIVIIADDGPGIAPEQQQLILKRGARTDTSKPGQGIGLAISVDIIGAYGGHLEIDKSGKLGGAEFRIHLPL